MAYARGTERCSCGATCYIEITCTTAYATVGERLQEFRDAHANCRGRTRLPSTTDTDVEGQDGRRA